MAQPHTGRPAASQRPPAPAHTPTKRPGNGRVPQFVVDPTGVILIERPDTALRALVDVAFGSTGFVLRRCRVIDTRDGRRAFVSPPQESIPSEEGGATKYRPLATIPKAWREAFEQVCLDAYQRALRERGGQAA